MRNIPSRQSTGSSNSLPPGIELRYTYVRPTRFQPTVRVFSGQGQQASEHEENVISNLYHPAPRTVDPTTSGPVHIRQKVRGPCLDENRYLWQYASIDNQSQTGRTEVYFNKKVNSSGRRSYLFNFPVRDDHALPEEYNILLQGPPASDFPIPESWSRHIAQHGSISAPDTQTNSAIIPAERTTTTASSYHSLRTDVGAVIDDTMPDASMRCRVNTQSEICESLVRLHAHLRAEERGTPLMATR